MMVVLWWLLAMAAREAMPEIRVTPPWHVEEGRKDSRRRRVAKVGPKARGRPSGLAPAGDKLSKCELWCPGWSIPLVDLQLVLHLHFRNF